MKKLNLLKLLGLALGCAAIAAANPTKAAGHSRPFQAEFAGNAHPSPEGPCTLANWEAGQGEAAHLGATTWADTETAYFLDCTPQTGPTGPAIAVDGTFTLTAANGDVIHGTFHTTGTFDPTTGVTVSGTYKFTSGTGRFVDVTGSGIITGSGSSAPPFAFVGTMTGDISY